MTSERQKAANRANARRSMGPKSLAGKRAVRLNALRHGLLARDVVLPDEPADAFEDLRNAVHADLAPSGPVEGLLADRVVNAMWRLRRLERAEAALFHWRAYDLKVNRLKLEVQSYEEVGLDRLCFDMDETVITDEASHAEAEEELGLARYERDRDEVLLGRTLDADARNGDAFGKLSRYETSLERSLFRNLAALRRLRNERQAAPVIDGKGIAE